MFNTDVKHAVPAVLYAFEAMESMGDRIRALRQAKGYTQAYLAELLGVTKSAVSQWEDGSTGNIKVKTFLRLVAILGTDTEYLVWGPERSDPEAEPTPPKQRRR